MDRFRGLNGTILLQEDHITLVRKGVIDTTFHEKGELQIRYDEVQEVKMVAGSLTNGYICIVKRGMKKPGTLVSAMKNDYAVIFRLTKNDEVLRLKRQIEERLL